MIPPMQNTETILRAAHVAALAHGAQMRKVTGRPYVEHPARVAARVLVRPDVDEAMVAAALLHDVVEDTAVTLDEIRAEFGDAVADLVHALTNVYKAGAHPGLNRAERKRLEAARLAGIPRAAKIIKMLDRIDNLREAPGQDAGFLRVYAAESRELAAAVGDADAALHAELLAEIIRLEASLGAAGGAA